MEGMGLLAFSGLVGKGGPRESPQLILLRVPGLLGGQRSGHRALRTRAPVPEEHGASRNSNEAGIPAAQG